MENAALRTVVPSVVRAADPRPAAPGGSDSQLGGFKEAAFIDALHTARATTQYGYSKLQTKL
jgi:hypothetical protein